MSESGDNTKRGQDPKKVALALVTLPISIISATSGNEVAQASQMAIDDADKDVDQSAHNDQLPTARGLLRQSQYEVKPADTLTSIAKQFSMSPRDLMRLNNLSDGALIMPGQILKLVDNTVQPAVLDKIAGAVQHKVKTGETLSQIAKQYKLKLPTLLALNELKEKSLIFPGQVLKVRAVNPLPSASEVADTNEHRVLEGETLGQIANRYRISLASLLKANSLTKTSLIFVGQVLTIPNQKDVSTSEAKVTANEIGKPTSICIFHGFHKIKAGETVSKLAAVYGVSTQALLTANSLSAGSTIYVGQKLVIPAAHSALNCPKLTVLTDEMKLNASNIISIGRQLGVGDYAIVIALATAMQESSLRNIAFGDRDSIGLFQQRPSAGWGTKEQIMQPDYSIRAFFGGPTSPAGSRVRGLLDIKDWHLKPLTEAAQSVQISAFPTAYAKWEPSAWNWLIELDGLEDS